MFITIAVIFIVLATFLLIMYNMYSDYLSRKEADQRMMFNRARNVISDADELLMNQAQLPYSKTLVLILRYRILNALRKLQEDPHAKHINEKITEQEQMIRDVNANFREDIAFRTPENDVVAVGQLRAIRRLRKLIYTEIRSGTPVDPVLCQKEDKRLSLLVIKVNISNLIQTVLELKRLHQVGSCRQLIEKGLDVIRKSGIKDEWLMEKSSILSQIAADIEREVKDKGEKTVQKKIETEKEEVSELDQLFGDKKKW
ncbi:Uncharacterised protein [Anaerobiospirillum thomasii]|uniref:DNA repair protein n=1 Tax=Anaerobiospirillum thomasii TaxID=179995 RepID=A0A2X0V5N7_9GAMM|nr:hypothetical protein [Anaerobiospirillum thomasii]SPT69804.1 Uncharacterised protein [Anaerobiospirillum thomasii]SPT71592.1 Uncharacterised protein [Anaerobiospirillum thomasii]